MPVAQKHPNPLLIAVNNVINDVAKIDRGYMRRRADARYHLENEVSLYTRQSGSELQYICDAWGQDMSYHGLGMLAPDELTPGEVYYVDLEKVARRPLVMPVKVLYCRKLTLGIYRVGSVFLYDRPPVSLPRASAMTR